MDGAFDAYWQDDGGGDLAGISNALQATLDPRTSNEIRQAALTYLEQVKTQPNAPNYGFNLASDWKQPEAVQYYGLQLLEYSIRYRWNDFQERHTQQIRQWVTSLAGAVREADALFIRNKIAQLWAEVAKRCWGEEWMDMDNLLVNLWETSSDGTGAANKLLVLYILEVLSEDICNSEDATAGLRLDVLGHAFNEIVIPEGLYREHISTRGTQHEVRCGDEGWFVRMCGFFASCIKESRVHGASPAKQTFIACAIKALNAMRPTMVWISLKAVAEANCIDCLFLAFHTDEVLLQTASTEVLMALLNRPYNAHFHPVWIELIQQTLRPDRVSMIKRAYGISDTSPTDDHDERYTLRKKISEALSVLGDSLAQHPELSKMGIDVPGLFGLFIDVLQSKSLVVSIPVLHSWTKLLVVQDRDLAGLVNQAIGTLLETCSERLMPYEKLPEDSDDDTVRYLYDDFDTMPERHAFLGNYRRYCMSVIETITRAQPLEALSHVLDQAAQMLQSGPYSVQRGFTSRDYSTTSLPVLRFDAQFSVVTSALKGFTYWMSDVSELNEFDPLHTKSEQDRDSVVAVLQQWCQNITTVRIDDPDVATEILQLLVMVTRTLRPLSDFVLKIVEHMLNLQIPDEPSQSQFSAAVKELEASRVLELQKLALAFPNELLDVYSELENRVIALASAHEEDNRMVWGYRAFLFMIVHRASNVDQDTRMARLRDMIRPVYEGWQDEGLKRDMGSFPSFLESVGLGHLPEFLDQHRFAKVEDWSSQQLDQDGKVRQAEIMDKTAKLPLRMTKAMLGATTEKLREGTDEHDIACALWTDVIPVILPSLLQMIRHAQAFNNMATWSHLPDELQMVIKRTLQDRFWQSGISNESRDAFYARINASKSSYEGFASTVRGTARSVREQGYHLLYLMTKFEEQFYSLPDLAEPLSDALFADANALSANHLQGLLNLAQGLVGRCPPQYRARFLPPLLTRLFTKLDAKISAEWNAIGQVSQQNAEDDDLSDEMRMESVLRQLTYTAVSFVQRMLGHDKASSQTNGHTSTKQALNDLVLSDPAILEPLILFCTHALRMRDSRCCVVICGVFRTLIPLFQSGDPPAPQVREFISTEVLKSCITSLNEPYFADLQKDLARLIAQIVLLYAPKTSTPRSVLLSLPQMSEAKVDKAIARIGKSQNDRQQRAVVLDLLDSVRGVSIHEAGKITREPARKRSAVQKQYMEVEQKPTKGDDVGLDGIAGMLGDG